jgi:hypothetical protein
VIQKLCLHGERESSAFSIRGGEHRAVPRMGKKGNFIRTQPVACPAQHHPRKILSGHLLERVLSLFHFLPFTHSLALTTPPCPLYPP